MLTGRDASATAISRNRRELACIRGQLYKKQSGLDESLWDKGWLKVKEV